MKTDHMSTYSQPRIVPTCWVVSPGGCGVLLESQVLKRAARH